MPKIHGCISRPAHGRAGHYGRPDSLLVGIGVGVIGSGVTGEVQVRSEQVAGAPPRVMSLPPAA